MNRYIISLREKYLIAAIGIAVVFASCQPQQAPALQAVHTARLDSLPGQCPYITSDGQGNTVISWVRMNPDSTASFCYAVSGDGRSFGPPVVVPNSHNIQPHGENLPKIIFKPSGEIIALWGVANPNPHNKYSGLVYYVQSFDKGQTWTSPRALTADTASYDQRYYDVALLPNGEAAVIWLDNRKASAGEGSGLYYASTSGNDGFRNEKIISGPCCQCCRTDLFTDHKGNIHAVYRAIIRDSIRDMVHIVSTDNAGTFSAPARISEDNWMIRGCPHTGPAIAENDRGLHFAWFTGGRNSGCFYSQSADNGKTFRTADNISPMGSHPQMAALGPGHMVIVWDEFVPPPAKPGKKIGIQLRDTSGRGLGTTFLTTDRTIAAYPVVQPLDDKTCMVAYSSKTNDRNFIDYQVIRIK